MSKIIIVEHLVKRYRQNAQGGKNPVNAIDDISFSVDAGEFFTLLGPNGAGKTTTISVLTTILSKTSGRVEIGGFDVDREASKVRRIIGIIFQSPSLDLNLTAEENVRMHAILYGVYSFKPTYGMMPQSYKARIKELADVLAISNDIFRPIKTFSGGMRRKLEIIRSLMHRPKVLFLDEPTIGLDPLSRKSLWEYLRKVRQEEKMTIFLTTHYLEEAEEADKVFIINKGKIVASGTPQRIKSQLVESYMLVDAKNRQSLARELKAKRLRFDEDQTIKVHLGKNNPQKVIQSIKTPLTFLEIRNPTLEDAYLSIVEEKEERFL